MKPWIEKTLERLISLHPRLLTSQPPRVRPIVAAAVTSLLAKHGEDLGHRNIKAALVAYQDSRHYRKALARGDAYTTLGGKETENRPSPEIRAVQEDWLRTNTIESCRTRLATSDPASSDFESLISILENDYRELKILSAMAAHSGQFKTALETRTKLVCVAESLLNADPSHGRKRAAAYAKYYEAISGCTFHVQEGNFSEAKEYSLQATQNARFFHRSRKFFPNYFLDRTEISAFGVYVDALDRFRAGDFGGAADCLDQWLELNSRWSGQGSARYDSNLANAAVCRALSDVAAGKRGEDLWNEAAGHHSSPSCNIYRPSRTLMKRLELLRSLTKDQSSSEINQLIDSKLREIPHEWRLLTTDARLSGVDRLVSLKEPVRLPSFVDLFHLVPTIGESWRFLLHIALRFALLLRAEYESLWAGTYAVGSQENVLPTFLLEKQSFEQLIAYTTRMIHARNPKDAAIFEKVSPLWSVAIARIANGTQAEAHQAVDEVHEKVRSYPHVIRVITSASATEARVSLRGREDLGARKRLVVKRVWRHEPKELELERPLQKSRSAATPT